MTPAEFVAECERLYEVDDTAGVMRLAEQHLRSVIMELTEDQEGRLEGILGYAQLLESSREGAKPAAAQHAA
jgi:hypothetical protein